MTIILIVLCTSTEIPSKIMKEIGMVQKHFLCAVTQQSQLYQLINEIYIENYLTFILYSKKLTAIEDFFEEKLNFMLCLKNSSF